MTPEVFWTIVAIGVVLAVVTVVLRKVPCGPQIPEELRAGHPLPDMQAADEDGNPVNSADLVGKPSILLFVRGSWCPFCNKQVEKLSEHYRELTSLGARLIFVTPKPLETTRRVAEFFEVEFDFWLDDQLQLAKSLGLVQVKGVPAGSIEEYGEDTVWPTAIITDADNNIRYSKLSRYIFDRPDPEVLVTELKKIV